MTLHGLMASQNTTCYPFELISMCNGGIFNNAHQTNAQVTFLMLRIVFWCVVAGVLHRIGWYWIL